MQLFPGISFFLNTGIYEHKPVNTLNIDCLEGSFEDCLDKCYCV